MEFFTGLVAGAALAAAAPSAEKRAPSPLEVKLEMLGNTEVKAVFTNKGKNNLKVLKTGSILDQAPVEKTKVFSGDKPVSFRGARLRIATEALQEEDFQRIPAGESVEVTFDIAQVHDLSSGGKFGVLADGALSFADDKSTKLIGSVPYLSNQVQAEVNGALAAAAHTAFHDKRARVYDCPGQKLQVIQTAMRNCASMAVKAQQAAASGPAAKMEEYFKSSSQQIRDIVSNVFSLVASECGSPNTSSSFADYYCTDLYSLCKNGPVAYTLVGYDVVVYCPSYFQDSLPDLANRCHALDRAGTNMHEATHLLQIKGTEDYHGYGYDAVRRLSAAQNLNHADTYSLFANAIRLGC
ncbi:Neutral protease 2 [Tolypocladium paradoxum]|uniref:Neutral protease 2 n=1 Tax=Tolypocladium paradoxum TaxID=94208 RepID=A0A2S4LAG3_9HYPO|nr:Neutral protease 2 [Tolypocladium paradoxum]